MNILNRTLAIAALLGLVVVLSLAILDPMASLASLSYALGSLEAFVAANVYVYWGVAGSLLLGAIVLLVLELRRPKRLTAIVLQAGDGVAELTTESVSRSLEYHIGRVPGVNQVRPVVESRGRSVRVALELVTDPLMDIPAKSEEVIQLTRELVEGKLGLKLAPKGLHLSIRQAPYAKENGPTATRTDVSDEPVAQGSALA